MPTTVLRPHPDSLSTELAEALAAISTRNGLERDFPAEVEREALKSVEEYTLPERDLLDIPFVTIDPEESTDLDQAVHIDEDGEGFRVRYAIADVPAFIAQGGALDLEARKRGQTIYAPDGRIPLHPLAISEDAASLLPGEERGAYVWDFVLDADGNVVSTELERARVRSRSKLSYDGVQRDLDAGIAPPVLQLLKRVGLARIELERQRGGASLNIPETEIERDGAGYRLVRRRPLEVEGWNAQISLMTGMAAARMMLDARIGIVRTMPPPEASAIAEFRRQTIALGHPWDEADDYGSFLRTLDTNDPRQLAIMHAAGALFRGAGYTAFDGEAPADPIQAAVAAPYAHATAPLRRLVDRFVLVCCESIAQGREVPQWVRASLPELPAMMAASAGLDGAVGREAVDTVEAAVLSTHVGEIFDAVVISVNGGKNASAETKGVAAAIKGTIQLSEPAVTARCTGVLPLGEHVRARLTAASITDATVAFETE